MSIITATYNALNADTELRGLLATNKLDATKAAIYEEWAADSAPMPYLVMTFSTITSDHYAKHETAVIIDIFTDGGSINAEAIKNRVIKILDRQEIEEENTNQIRFYYNADDRIEEEEPNIVHWQIEFTAYYWRKNFIDHLNA